VHDITFNNNKVSSTAQYLKYTGFYLKHFRIRIFLNTGMHRVDNHSCDIHEPAFILVPLLCMC